MKRGKPLKRTELRRKTALRSGPVKPRRAETEAPSVAASARRAKSSGPVKARLESSRIPKAIRLAVLARDDRACQRCGISLYGQRYSLQHRDARGMGGSRLLHTMANLVALCGSATTGCHGHVESEPIESDRDGWSVPNGADPEDWPLKRFGKHWMQPGDGWVKAEPHPRQIEMGAAA